jgi:two-component system, NarL family, nitrate/nitrite response regulator NarL
MLRAREIPQQRDSGVVGILGEALRIVIVGQDVMGSSLLATMIKGELNCEAIVTRASELMTLLSNSATDVAVINADINSKPGAGYELAEAVSKKYPDVRIVMLIEQPTRDATISSLRAGACGIFNRQLPIGHFVDCVKHVRDGSIWAGPTETKLLLSAIREIPSLSIFTQDPSILLSTRELQVVRAAASGRTNREIAVELRLSEHTVKNYLFRAFEKLGVSSRAQLLFYLATKIGHNRGEEYKLAEG